MFLKKRFLILLIASLCSAASLRADEGVLPQGEQADLPLSDGLAAGETKERGKHQFEMGSEIYYVKYEEPGFMKNEGLMYGINAAYTYRHGIFFKLEGRGAWGQVDYTSAGTGSSDNINDYLFETRANIGYEFLLRQVALRPFIGFGYRYLNDDSAGTRTTTGAAGYERESNYLYSPLGLEATTWVNEKWELVMTGEYDFFWYGRQISYLSGAVAGLSDISNDQPAGYGIRGSIGARRHGKKVTLLVEPFVRWWRIEDSDFSSVTFGGVQVGYGLEPANETIETGLKVSVIF